MKRLKGVTLIVADKTPTLRILSQPTGQITDHYADMHAWFFMHVVFHASHVTPKKGDYNFMHQNSDQLIPSDPSLVLAPWCGGMARMPY